MKMRAITFTEQMVLAIIEGRKTQTRRPVIPPPPFAPCDDLTAEIASGQVRCKYAVGDLLWVRERVAIVGGTGRGGSKNPNARLVYCDSIDADCWMLRPSIHMPSWASRITLKITNVRAEKLQDISEADAKAEGTNAQSVALSPGVTSYVATFVDLWDAIYEKRGLGWESNPWVWVVEFRVEEITT